MVMAGQMALRRRAGLVLASASLCVAGIGLLDYLTGPEIAFSPFYIVPIAGAAWYADKRSGVIVAVIAAVCWLLADILLPQHSDMMIALWNAVARLITFLIIALLLSYLRVLTNDLSMIAERRGLALVAEQHDHDAARTALRESEDRFRTLIENIEDYAIFMLDLAGHVVTWNEGAQKLTGYSAERMIGRHFGCLWPHDELEADTPAQIMLTAATVGSSEFEGPLVRADGTRFWALTLLAALRDAQGRATGYSNVIHDITQRKRLENEVVETEERERRRIGRDLHDVLGQDLTGIAFLGKELEEDLAAQHVAQAADAARIARLANQAISRARSLARGLCPIDLNSGGVIFALRRLAEEISDVFGVRCECLVQDSVKFADEAAALHTYRIAQEAASNAIKHGQAGHVRIKLVSEAGNHVLTVEDDGCGIADPLVVNGGMGLAVMRYRAAVMGGTFDIKRLSRHGTRVTCTVPSRSPVFEYDSQDDKASESNQENAGADRR